MMDTDVVLISALAVVSCREIYHTLYSDHRISGGGPYRFFHVFLLFWALLGIATSFTEGYGREALIGVMASDMTDVCSRITVAGAVFCFFGTAKKQFTEEERFGWADGTLLGLCVMYGGGALLITVVSGVKRFLELSSIDGLYLLLLSPYPFFLLQKAIGGGYARNAYGDRRRRVLLSGFVSIVLGGFLMGLTLFRIPSRTPGLLVIGAGVLIYHEGFFGNRVSSLRRLFLVPVGLVVGAIGMALIWPLVLEGEFRLGPQFVGRVSMLLVFGAGLSWLFQQRWNDRKQEVRTEACREIATTLRHHLHEANQSIKVLSDLMKRKRQKTASSEASLYIPEQIQEVSRDLEQLVRGMEMFSEEIDMDQGPVSLDEVVHEGLRRLNGEWKGGLDVVLDASADLPPVLGNREGLRRVFQELLVNAAEARNGKSSSGDAGEPIRVRLESRNGLFGPRLSVCVEDRGEPLPEGDPDRLKNPFVSTRDEHYGLGLTVVDQILNAHNTQLDIQENRQDGSVRKRFSFSLPVAPGVGNEE